MQKCLLLAEGISFAGFLRIPITAELNNPARYRGPHFPCDRQGKKLDNITTNSILHNKERLSKASGPAEKTWTFN
jgi:hypothetical protein